MDLKIERAELPFGATPLLLETGRIGKQADASIVATIGGTTVMVNVTVSPEPTDRDFFPLMVDYREKYYAAGRLPGGFFKREGRPGDLETLKARITDRAIRPLFPEGYLHEVMVYITVLSYDGIHPAEVAALGVTSLALQISSIPFPTATAAVRVGRINGQFVLNPNLEQEKESDLDLLVAGTKTALNMVEAGAREINEADTVAALKFAHDAIRQIIAASEDFVARAGKPKQQFVTPTLPAGLKQRVHEFCKGKFDALVDSPTSKTEFSDGEHGIIEETVEAFEDDPEAEGHAGLIAREAQEVLSRAVRRLIIKEKKRVDGRGMTEIRPVTVEAPLLPQTHGSALFTRGQTQAIGVVTLGTVGDAQMIDTMLGTYDKFFFLQYNFPPYSVGEAKPMRAPGRREIGHGALAERALEPMIPPKDDFPYTIRVVSEITESNGSSSMASVCVGSLAMMDAGVPLKKPVAGIAMGLVGNDEGEMAVLTDIQGVEDHLGDMDFKVAGTRDGITALQMDIKIEGVTFEIMEQALAQAREARLSILETMGRTLAAPREEMAAGAPRVTTIQIPVSAIGQLIGPGGKTIRGIVERTGAKIDVEDDGRVFVSAADGAAANAAVAEIKGLTAEVEIGEIYEGKCVRTTDFGAFLEIIPGKDGMVHISDLDIERTESVEDVVQVGDVLKVKVTNVDPTGRIRLSRKAVLIDALPEAERLVMLEQEAARADRDRGDRGGRGGGGDRGGRGGGGGRDRDRGGRGSGGRGGGGDRGGRGGGAPSGGPRERSSGGEGGEYGFREKPRSRDDD